MATSPAPTTDRKTASACRAIPSHCAGRAGSGPLLAG
jgi:hypothetical protein